MSTEDLARRARAHGFDVSVEHDPDVVSLRNLFGLGDEVWLVSTDDDHTVEVMFAEAMWSYVDGPDFRETLWGTLPYSEALSMIAWQAKVQERYEDEITHAEAHGQAEMGAGCPGCAAAMREADEDRRLQEDRGREYWEAEPHHATLGPVVYDSAIADARASRGRKVQTRDLLS